MPSLAGIHQVFENRVFPLPALFETTASAFDSTRACLASRLFCQSCGLAYFLMASHERTEPEAESKADAVVSKGAYVALTCKGKTSRTLMQPNF